MASEEAETYLRLMAETELRHALALPKVRERRHGRLPRMRLVRIAFHRLGLTRLALARLGRARARAAWGSGGFVSTGWTSSSLVAYASATVSVSGHSAHTVRSRMLRVTRVRWYLRRLLATRTRQRHQSAYEGLHRLAVAADALAAVDAVDEEVARKVLTDQGTALELRQRLFSGPFDHLPRAAGPPAGPFRAVSIAKRTEFEVDGDRAEITLLALVVGPDRAVLTFTARRQTESDHDNGFWFLDSGKAVDNLGSRYSLSCGGGGGRQEWTGELELHPLPRPGVHWLDLTFVPGTPPMRIGLDQVMPPEPAVEPLPRSELAERYLDKMAEQLLAERRWEAPRLGDGVDALLGAGLITPDNPAMARLAALAKRLGARLPPNLADRPDTELPAPWLSALDTTAAMDGPTGIAPAAAVLPELDGSRWAIAGLRSKPDCAELHVLGWGAGGQRSYHPRFGAMPAKFSWWARDSTGRWHVAIMNGGSWSDQHSAVELRLTPALHPEATSIDIVVTGKSGRITVTLPLDWEAGA